MNKTLITTLLLLSFVSCSKKESSSSSSGSTTVSTGAALTTVISAFESVGTVTTGSSLTEMVSYRGEKSGVANTYCTTTSGPTVASSHDDYAGQDGYCLSSHNAQSPDSPAGTMYTAAGIICVAGNAGLFDNLSEGGSNSESVAVTIDTTCWGSATQVQAQIDDNSGSSSYGNIPITVTRMTSSHPYDYKVVITAGNTMTAYIKVSSDTIAAVMDDNGSAWAFNFNTSTGKLVYENIDTTNFRRIRVLIEGTYSTATSKYTAITNLKGFHMEGSDNTTLSYLTTFTGSSSGILGNYYSGGTTRVDKCYKPGGSADCTGVTSVASSTTHGTNLLTADNTAATNLLALASLLSITDIDPSVTDITQ